MAGWLIVDMRVLLAESDHDMRRLLAYALTREGYDIATAESSPVLFAQAHALQPDVILANARLLEPDEPDLVDLPNDGSAAPLVRYSCHEPLQLGQLLFRVRAFIPR